MTRNGSPRPRALRDGVIVEELPDELLLYQIDRFRALRLDGGAARIWRLCDGGSTIPEIARELTRATGSPVDEALVWYTVERFSGLGLLEERVTPPYGGRTTRRELLTRMGAAAALSIPVIATLTAPPALAAVTVPCVTATNCGQKRADGTFRYVNCPCFTGGNRTECGTKRCKQSGPNAVQCVGQAATGPCNPTP